MYQAVRLLSSRSIHRFRLPVHHISRNRPSQSRKINTNARTRTQVLTHTAAGIAGGATVLLGVYAYYHFSGIKQRVNSFKDLTVFSDFGRGLLRSFSGERGGRVNPSPNEAFRYLRNSAKACAAWMPGSGVLLDTIFDEAELVFEAHREESNAITLKAYKDISAILHGSTDGIANLKTATKVGEVLLRWGGEMHALGMTAGRGAVTSLRERHPAAMEAMGRSLQHMKKVAAEKGEGSKKTYNDVKQTVQERLAPASSFVQRQLFRQRKDSQDDAKSGESDKHTR